jgi:RNA polymerase sigma-70 factor (ECF subfamily)
MSPDGNNPGAGRARGSAHTGQTAATDARLFCVVASHLEGHVRSVIGDAAAHARIRVVVEQRLASRRGHADRRRSRSATSTERRVVHSAAGRRAGDRRASVVEVATPRKLRALERVDGLCFVRRARPTFREARDIEGARLAMRFQAGDTDAFAALYRSYFHDIYSYLRVFLADEIEAEDAAQQVFMKVLAALPRYEHYERRFGRWIFAIARNVAFDITRRHRPLPTDPELLNACRDGEARAASVSHPDDAIADFDLVEMINALPALQREIILMRFAVGMSLGEVAEALNRSPDSVSGMQYRAFRALEDALIVARHPGALNSSKRRRRRAGAVPAMA